MVAKTNAPGEFQLIEEAIHQSRALRQLLALILLPGPRADLGFRL